MGFIKSKKYADGKYYFYRAGRGIHRGLEYKVMINHSKDRYFRDGAMEELIGDAVTFGGTVYDYKNVMDGTSSYLDGTACILMYATMEEILRFERVMNCAGTKSGSPFVLILKDDFSDQQLRDLIEGL